VFGIYKEEFSTSLNDPVFEWDKDGGGFGVRVLPDGRIIYRKGE